MLLNKINQIIIRLKTQMRFEKKKTLKKILTKKSFSSQIVNLKKINNTIVL